MPDTDAAAPTMVRASPGSAGMLAVGQRFAGRYEIKAILGVGGLGVVYRAWDSERGLPLAIRALHADVVASEPTVLQRVQDEMRLVQLVAHRNVVRTYDTGAVEGLQFIAMEYVEGRSLQQLVRERGRLPVGIVVTLGKQLCRALAAAHAQGVLHRALTPQNIGSPCAAAAPR